MIYLAFALVSLGYMALTAFREYLDLKRPKEMQPGAEYDEIKADLARIKLLLNIRTVHVDAGGMKK